MLDQNMQKILLVVCGMSPQVMTETLYALIRERNWIPNKIHLITTEKGRENAVMQLLEGEKHFQQLLNDYQVSQSIDFNVKNITVIKDNNDCVLADLRTPEDNEAAANTISSVIRELTKEPTVELHVSLAGGRKTMGFYAGYALSLFGRPQDMLSHVLVSNHYERNRHFFYPTPYSKVIHSDESETLDAREAEVWLAEIPFVRLRFGLPQRLLEGQHSFGETVKLARKATEKAKLVLDPEQCCYKINGEAGELTSVQMAILLWAATRGNVIRPLVEGEKSSEYAKEILNLVNKYSVPLHGSTEKKLENGDLMQTFLETNISRLNSKLNSRLGPELSGLCKLVMVTQNGDHGYALPTNLEISFQS